MSPAGQGEATVNLWVSSLVDYGTNGLSLTGLVDTRADALTVAIRGQYAYVGGSTTVTVVDIADPRNPKVVRSFGSGQRTALTADRLLVGSGLNLEVYGLTDPRQPDAAGSVVGGVSGPAAVHLLAHGDHAFVNTLIYGWQQSTLLFIRGDVLSFDLRDPRAPRSLGLLFNPPHTDYPQYPGSDFFIGEQSAAKDGILLVPSTTVAGSGVGGTGRLWLVNAREPGAPTLAGGFAVPGTALLTGVAVQGDQALVVGNRAGFAFAQNSFSPSGNPTLTLLDVEDPLNPVVVGETTDLADVDAGVRANLRAFGVASGVYVLGNVVRQGQPVLELVDARHPGSLDTLGVEVPARVAWATAQGNLLYTASSAGLAIYDLGGVLGIPVVAEARVPNDGSVTIVPGSYNLEPDEIVRGAEGDTLVWRFTLSAAQTNRVITWQSRVPGLAPGETRDVALGATVGFNAWGVDSSVELPAVTVAGLSVLGLAPASQAVRPGEPAAYALSVTNVSATAQTFTFQVQGLPADWIALASSTTVPAHEVARVPMVLRAETSATSGEHGFTIWAEANGSPVGVVGGTFTSAGPPRAANPARGVVLSLSPAQAAAGQGTPAFVNVRVTNTGNTTETFALAIRPPPEVAWGGGPLTVEVPPGLENYREAQFVLIPEPGTAPGARAFTVTAIADSDPTVQATADGSLTVLPLGVVLDLTPERAALGTTFTLHVSNPGPNAQTYDLNLGGPLAPAARLGQSSVTLEAGAAVSIPVTFTATDFAYPGELPLLAGATARADARVSEYTVATVEVPETHGLEAWFDPELVGLLNPGEAAALLLVRNTGNVEEPCRLEIVRTEGPVTAALLGPGGQATPSIASLRLPGLAGGAVLLHATLSDPQPGRVRVRLTSLTDPTRQAEASAHFLVGVWLSLERLVGVGADRTRLWFSPLPGYCHTVESQDSLGTDSVWQDLPGAPHDQGQAFDFDEASRRFYRVRIEVP